MVLGRVVERVGVWLRDVVGRILVGDVVVAADEVVAADHLRGREAARLDHGRVVRLVGGDRPRAAEVGVRVVDPGIDIGDRHPLAAGAELVPDVGGADERDAALVEGADYRNRLHRAHVRARGERRRGPRGEVGREAVDERVIAKDDVAAERPGASERAGLAGARSPSHTPLRWRRQPAGCVRALSDGVRAHDDEVAPELPGPKGRRPEAVRDRAVGARVARSRQLAGVGGSQRGAGGGGEGEREHGHGKQRAKNHLPLQAKRGATVLAPRITTGSGRSQTTMASPLEDPHAFPRSPTTVPTACQAFPQIAPSYAHRRGLGDDPVIVQAPDLGLAERDEVAQDIINVLAEHRRPGRREASELGEVKWRAEQRGSSSTSSMKAW